MKSTASGFPEKWQKPCSSVVWVYFTRRLITSIKVVTLQFLDSTFLGIWIPD